LIGGVVCIIASLCHPPIVTAQRPLNLDFETASVAGPERPWGWNFGWFAFTSGTAATFGLDSTVARGGRRSLRIDLRDTTNVPPQSIMLQIPSAFAAGHEIQLTGYIRALMLNGRAALTLEAWKNQEFAAADTAWLDGRAAAARPEWSERQLRIRVPPDAHSVVVTAVLEAPGTVWFDDLELRVDGKAITEVPARADAVGQNELAWLRANVTPLRSVQPPTAPDDRDLESFTNIVGNARIVALGESTHGTHEFFRVKHRLLEYLVRRHGFTVFAIEANQLAVEKVNGYVQRGEGTARDAMRSMFRVWNTEEMLALVEWMRQYNATHRLRMLRFAGYDMQDQRTPGDTLRAYLARTEPALVPRFDTLLGEYRAQRTFATPQVPDSMRARWLRQSATMWDEVSARRANWLARATNRQDSLAVEWAVQSANLFRQAARLNASLNSPDRDSLMAANLDWTLRTLAPRERAVVWAHDVHVSRGGDAKLSFNGGAQMGAYLSRLYGDDYRAFSLLTYDGAYTATRSFNDHRMIEAQAFPAPVGSLEAALHGVQLPPASVGFTVDLRRARTDPDAAWLRSPRPIRHIGYAAYDYGFEFDAVLPLEFDGVIFIDRTTASRLLQ
jgi:erythromycin esterase